MNLKKIVLALLLPSLSAPLLAASYYLVVPSAGKLNAQPNSVAGPITSSRVLNFGLRQRGTAGAPLAITLTNPGPGPLVIEKITIPQGGADGFSVQHDCTVLAADAQCVGFVAYNPATAGNHTNTLTVTHSGTRRTTSVRLEGAAREPAASLHIAEFGEVNVGSAKDQAAVFTNSGIGPLWVGTPAVFGNGYSVVVHDCPSPLAPAESCSITTRLTAPAAGPLDGRLVVPSGAGPVTTTLAGTGVRSDLQFTSGALPSFGSVSVGQSTVSGTVTLKNTGTATADNLSLTIRGAGAAAYAIQSSTCGSSLSPGGSCTFTVKFNPAALGSFAAELHALSAGKSMASSPLSGVGASTALFIAARTSISVILVGTTNSEYYTVTNSSPSPVALTSKSLSHPEPAISYEFGGGSNECGPTIPAKASCRINFKLNASDSVGSKPLTLTLNTSAGKLTANTLSVSASWAKLVPTPAAPSFDFGNVILGNAATAAKVTVTDKSSAINVNGLEYSLPDGFQMVDSSCGATSVRGAVCEFYLRFTPTKAKAYSGTFTMTSRTQYTGTGGTPTPYELSIPLSGTGVLPATISWQGGVYGTVEQGTSRVGTMTLFNPTGSSVALGPVTLSGNTTEFSLTGTTCSSSLAANSSCTATLSFTPNGTGSRAAGTLTTTVNGVAVSKSVAGTAGVAVLTPTPVSLAYPSRYPNKAGMLNAFADLKVTIKNTGTAVAENLANRIVYNDIPLNFSLQYNSCVNRLNAGSSCSLYLRAVGSVVGSHAGSLRFSSASSQVSVPFTFNIVPFDLTLNTAIPVQDTVVGEGSISRYSIQTNSTGAIYLGTPTITGNTTEFSLAAGSTCADNLTPNASCYINVLFTPTGKDVRQPATLTVPVGGVLQTITLSGSGL